MKYVRVVQWSREGDIIRLEMLGEDDQIHVVEVGTECAAVLVAGLATELEKITADTIDQQCVRPKGLQTGKTEKGEPLLFLTLEGGVELPLVFKPEALPVLISELQGLSSILGQGAQFRWQ